MNKKTEKEVNDLLSLLELTEKAQKTEGLIQTVYPKEKITAAKRRVEKILEQELAVNLTEEIDVKGIADEDWLFTMRHILAEIKEPLFCENWYDKDFHNLLSYIWKSSKKDLLAHMKHNLEVLKMKNPSIYQGFVEYFTKFPLWGSFSPNEGDDTTLELRVEVLKRHSYDFLWLYKRMNDALSRRTLYAILLNWALLDFDEIAKVKSPFIDYYEPDIFPNNKNDVFADVGAFVGDSIESYVKVYGTEYKKIYAYEVSEDSYKKLCENTAELPNVETRKKAVGSKTDTVYLEKNTENSANRVTDASEENEPIEMVALDEDISEEITFIKMDIEGAETDALYGARKSIENTHPKLAVCVYHGYDDLWRIPSVIDKMNPNYNFWLRHYGGNLIPTEFVLLCKDKE